MSTRCPCCKKAINYSLIQAAPHPDSEGCCYDCLSAEAQEQYDKFYGRNDAMERGDYLRDRAKDERSR